MTFTNPAGLWLGLLAIPIIVLHVLRPRRTEVVVSSTYLWESADVPVSAAAPWQRLRASWLLLVQLLVVALLAGAVARPVRTTSAPLAQHTVFILDASGSMAARDGSPTRLDKAKQRASQLRSQLPQGGLASIVVAGAEPSVVLSTSGDADAFATALSHVQPTAAVADFAGAFTLAASLETPAAPIGFVLLSDGGLTDAERRLLPAGTRYERIGDSSTNRAIAQLSVEPRGSGLLARVTLRNTGGPAATQTLRLDVDGVTARSEPIVLDAGATVERTYELPQGDRVEAFLEGEDLLSADDHAFAVGAARPPLKVLVAGPVDAYLDQLLAVIPGLTIERVAVSRAADGFDLAIYDQVEVPASPGAPFLAISPPGGAPGVAVSGSIDQPALTLVRTDDPVLDGLDLSAVGIAKAQRVEAPGDTVLVGSDATPLVLTGNRLGVRFAYVGFALADSNLPVQVAYPVLIDRLVASLGGATNAARDLRVGDRLPVVTDHDIRVRRPGGAVTNVAAGTPAPIADVPGFWTVTSDGRPDRVLAVDAPERESSLKPVADLPVEPRPVNPGERAPRGEVPLLPWLAAALGVLALGEWLLARRRLGVPRRQWRVATIARLAVVALVLGALVAPSIRTRVDRVATMFLIDGSDSLGAGGRADAVAWVRDALKAQHGSDRAGVAVFGGDARLELTVQQRAALEGSTVKVDASRTNLAGALRLAGAVLPSDAKRRIVLVSDGRPTDGDATAEIDRLKAAGVPVDVHLVGRAGGSDVSVGRVDVPGNVHVGERFDVRATIVATDAGPARVTLLRDGSAIDERVVDLVAGPNDISFSQVAPATSGTVRFQVQITQAGDSVAENDTGFGAVIVEGAPRVLVVEGVNGEAATLAAALRAGGISVDVTPLAKLPSAEQLSGYASTVLVDVDANNMAPDQVAALGSATRDAGRGLVVVGGDHAYELGGYRSSALEDLLPVVSEVTDPKRRLDVAQVLAIDTSGSMGACHCAQGSTLNGVITGGNLMGPAGGVSKTDISKAAAARTIEALGANDEVGVLAFNTEQKWVVPLQKLPPQDVVSRGIRSLTPAGGTDLHDPLQTAAAKLRASQAKLKHIILFTDGFTNPGVLDDLATQAKALADEGITVSVLATGEVAYDELKKVADAGRGRFYAGEDLQRIPQLMVQEALLAARDVVQEGRFLPTVTSTAAPVRSLTASPAILGYLATTAKPTAVTHLVLGEEKDPLLASWQLGLGRVTAWTSDAAARWSKEWAGWDGYAAFWTGVVKDTFPAGGDSGGAVRASVVGNRMKITVEQPGSFAADATATARVASPDGSTQEVALRRVDDATFAGEADASSAGTYSVGASVGAGAGPVLSATTLASQSYAAEYQPGLPDRALLEGLSARSGGRGSIQAAQAFDGAGLRSGRSSLRLAPWFLLAAALVWPMAVALSRLSLRGSVASAVGSGWQRTGHALRSLARRAPRPGVPASARPASSRAPTPVSAPGDGAVGPDHPTAPSPGGASAAPDAGEGTTPSQDGPRPPADNLGKLLERKRNR